MSEQENLLIQKANEKVIKYKAEVRCDPYRLNYHLMPPVGLLNDPNGLIQFKGVYHVFYQWNPFDTSHGAKFWGHYSSKDMVHWKEEPVALAPSEWYEKDGCYSGSAVESEGKLYLFYTGNVKREDGKRESYQCLAVSSDGINFKKYGPVIHLPEQYTPHFRDPKVWKRNNQWYMILGAQTLEEKGTAVLFTSKDLLEWKEVGRIAGSEMNELEEFGYMWECPDLIHLNGKDILLVSPQGLEPEGNLYNNIFQSGYFIGELDYHNHTFQHGGFTELDRGFDFYAPQTFTDESKRTILYGWMGITDETEPFHPTIPKHWVHALTIPRELMYREGKVYQKPVDELKKLRKNEMVLNVKAGHDTSKDMRISSAELLMESINMETDTFQVSFRNEAILSYDSVKREMSLQRRSVRTNSLETRFCKMDTLFKLQIFIDQSSLEIFVNDGEEVFTTRFFPDPANESLTFQGKVDFKLTKWDIGKLVIL